MTLPLLIEIGSNPIWIFSLFVFFLLTCHAWFVYWKPIDEIGWKRVDYFWLGVAAIGLVGQSAQVRHHWYSTAYDISQFKVAGALRNLKNQADFSVGPAICREFMKTEHSPKDFEKIQAEFNFACAEFTRITQEVSKSPDNQELGFIDLFDTSLTKKKLTDSMLVKTLTNLEMAHRRFNDALQERNYAKYKKESTVLEALLIDLSPFLIIFALALRITKVTGEIRLKRHNSMRPAEKREDAQLL